MGVFIGSASGDTPEMRAWCMSWLVDGSYALGGNDLDYDDGRFVGIAPEALSALGKDTSNIKSYTMADLQLFDKLIERLESTLHPDVLISLKDLRKKL